MLTNHDGSSVVVDYLCDRVIEQDMAVACFYYDFASREAQSPTNMLGSLLKQLLNGLGEIPVEIVQKFRGQKSAIGGRRLQLLDIVKMCKAVTSLRRTFICIDALDECVPRHLLEVLGALGQILQGSPDTRILMTGRSHILGVVERQLGGRTISVSIVSKENDIVKYLRARLERDTTPEVMDSFLAEDIINSIAERSSGRYVPGRDPGDCCESCTDRCKCRFLMVSLKVEAVLRETTIRRRRNRLNTMGDGLGLGDAYEATLGRIRAQDGEKTQLAMTTLMWVCYSERPLRVGELCHALAVETGSSQFNSDNVPAIETVLACCQGLVMVDREASTARLTHHTLREYLTTHCNFFPTAQLDMAETCLTYLNSDQAKALPTNRQRGLSTMPFLKYCSRYWGIHARRELSDGVILLAKELLDKYKNHVAANVLFLDLLDPDDSFDVNSPPLFGGLHCVSFFGIVDVMTVLLGTEGHDANQGDSAGITPLIWAVRGGQGEAVDLLLRQEVVNAGKPDNHGNTPLWWAARNGHNVMVKQLLDRAEVNPDHPNDDGFTPLLLAAVEGHELVVKQLLGRGDVNPDHPNDDGFTPLLLAAMEGHESVVKQLLDRGEVDAGKPTREGYTPLNVAAAAGNGSVVKQLLRRAEVNPDYPTNEGYTPLIGAAMNGHGSVVKQLLDRQDVNPDRPDSEGNTPLSWAAIEGHGSVVKQLLDRQDVDPGKPDGEDKTPLLWAARKGHESVVKQLLDRQDVEANKPDKDGQTPLSWAARKGHESVVRQLLDRQGVNSDKADNEGKTPLSWAATKGHGLVVKQLLDRQDVDTNKPDKDGQTPLSWAARKGHESVVRQLLDRQDVNPDKADNKGRTSLSWAAMEGHEPVVKHLLDRRDVNPGKPDKSGHIPFYYASSKGHEGVASLLQTYKPPIPASFEVDQLRASLLSSTL